MKNEMPYLRISITLPMNKYAYATVELQLKLSLQYYLSVSTTHVLGELTLTQIHKFKFTDLIKLII